MTAYRITIAELKDLSEVTLICGNEKCSTQITLDALNAPNPDACPTCGKTFDESLKAALAALCRFHREMAQTKARIEFQIKEPIQRD
jgi:hypothetical protein